MTTLSETRIENRYRVQPNHANNYESLHGGTLMKWMDEVARWPPCASPASPA